MKLTSVTVHNFRSYFSEHGKGPTLTLGDGINLLVGPNNCGKSNLLRAISLALNDSDSERFEPNHDIPSQQPTAHPKISLTFQCDGKTAREKTLLKMARDYERSSGTKKTHADDSQIILHVKYQNARRYETLAIKGAANKKGDARKLDDALAYFHDSIRFIYLRSGESLDHFLTGAFKELLHIVLQKHLSGQVNEAKRLRDDYVARLTETLLTPLGMHAQQQLADVMEEILNVKVEPYVPELEETLSRANIIVQDAASTSLINKGSGVRGALLVALLGYLAQHSRKNLILAVEEPESFLHPGAQQELRGDLNTLAKRRDVTLLVTTHSPFILDRSKSTTITALAKQSDGRTTIAESIRGNDCHTPVLAPLFGETITPTLLDSIQHLQPDAETVVFVEGYTDKFYLETAAEVSGRGDLLDGLEIRADKGAYKAAVQAVLLRQMVGNGLPIGALFDHDQPGKDAASLLKEKFNWRGPHVVTYRKWRQLNPAATPVEAEDMFPADFMERFLDKHPGNMLAEKMQFSDGSFHYGLTQDGKDAFIKYVKHNLRKSHTKIWIEILEYLKSKLRPKSTVV
ncbi:MAG: ATP-binding protein, partial [Planctomycetales bacterium]